MKKNIQPDRGSRRTSDMGLNDQSMDIKSIMKDVEFLASSHMTWKQRKDLENRKVVALGGKPVKQHRLPLSIARVAMKKQKERDQKMQQENLILGRFGANNGNGSRKVQDKRKSGGDKGLRSTTQGHFRNGILDVKHMINQPTAPRENDQNPGPLRKGKTNNGNNKKNKGKKKGGGGKKRR
ncbi:uncharacterized protein LOC124936251 [Impatiens glandulifera]|uniref:uncharacterized protein LOC124936251 n=1 Tax=Impatiens glandulifera TaxID=253017 RepID=UPI001FB0888C|nr:uncharacterized protein LOC124936251 [Impatiens glandulifera]